MTRDLSQRIVERASLDDLVAMCRLIMTHPKANKRERARAERELRKIEALRAKERAS